MNSKTHGPKEVRGMAVEEKKGEQVKERSETRQEKLDREFDEHMAREAVTTGHRIVAEFDACGAPWLKLLHPEGGCKPVGSCAECGADLTDPDSPRCPDCAGIGPDWCWLLDWFDDAPDECLWGTVEFPVEAIWDGDSPVIRIVPEAPDA